jgi:peptidoglycan/LPS O-acetylase OafA/YrhL
MVGGIGVVGLEWKGSELIKETFKHTFFGFLYMSVILLVVSNNSHKLTKKILQNPVFQYLGKISYGIYVWHLLVIYLLDHFFKMGCFSGFLWVSLLTITISALSFALVESPFLRLKAKFEG